MTNNENEQLIRWNLILGSHTFEKQKSCHHGNPACDQCEGILGKEEREIDAALTALYETSVNHDLAGEGENKERSAGLEPSSPNVARWLGDIRKYFSTPVVRMIQQDALERLNIRELLLEPELLEVMEPDVSLVADLLALKDIMPAKTKETARIIVRKVVEDVEKRLKTKMVQAIRGSLNRSVRNLNPKHNEINWNRTILANMKHYQPEYKTVIPQKLIGFGRKRSSLKHITLCIDESGSMASSVVYASILGSIIASIRSIKTNLVVFDTSIVDLSDKLEDPVDILFGVQLGGGTDINKAVGYCQSLISVPTDSIMILISDLIEGGDQSALLNRINYMIDSGIYFIVLLALTDKGIPAYDQEMAQKIRNMGAPVFGCTPDMFPDLIAAAINRVNMDTVFAKYTNK